MRCVLVFVVAALVGSCGVRGKRIDTTAMVAELGIDGAVEALRVRIGGEPSDVGARRALAALEDRRGRPGAVLEQLEIVAEIGGPFGSRLDRGERRRLAALYRERAAVRAARGSPDGVADLERAHAIDGGDAEAQLAEDAAYAAAISGLRQTDPDRRAEGARRIAKLDDSDDAARAAMARALADPAKATVDDLGVAGLRLWQVGAKRAARGLLEEWERRGGEDPEIADAWLAALAWWGGEADRPDLATLSHAVELGASPCHFALTLGDHGCSAKRTTGADLVARGRARGWRTSDPDEAVGWVVATAQAWRDGDVRSWLDELDARVDLVALGADTGRLPASIPAWARAPMLRAVGRADDAALALDRARTDDDLSEPARLVLALETALSAPIAEAAGAPAPAVAEVIASAAGGGALAELARAFRDDPSSADRVAADVVARDVDDARASASVAELFAVLGDPARSRAWWERAVASSPSDPVMRAGLVRGLAVAGDGAAARLAVVTAAAQSGDAGRAMFDGARALASAGLLVDALVPAKQALELTAPGEQQEVLALLLELVEALDRDEQVASLGAALAGQQAPRDTTTLRSRALAGDSDALARAAAADPADAALAILVAAGEDDAAAIARLAHAAAWNPNDVPVRAALIARGDRTALPGLARIAATGRTRELRAAAVHAYVSA